jgi:acetate kinase
MADLVLALNAGSSTLKFALFALDGAEPRLRFRGLVDHLGQAPHLTVRSADGQVVEDRTWPGSPALGLCDLARDVLEWAEAQAGQDRLAAFSHRIVHGGTEFHAPVELTAERLDRLEALDPLAPLHQPCGLAMARAVAAERPDILNVGCFDTAFFHDLPTVARRVPLPSEWEERGVRRYGFHGLSYAFLARRLQALRPLGGPRRVIFAHLGSGSSLCACLDGQPVDTTMGFSPLDGVVMSTRCGALDPGVILYLLRQGGLGVEAIEDLLYRRSGLLALSGLTGDLRELLASASPAAQEAVEIFVASIVREIGALTARLGGLDALVFSAGIGEHAPEIRRRVCEQLAWLGLRLDGPANAAGAVKISLSASAVSVWVIPTDEEHTLADGARAVLASRLIQSKVAAA